MKYLFSFLLFGGILLTSCTGTKKAAQPDDLATLSWLLGKWDRQNTKPGQTASESWEKVSATEWKGKGVSMKNGVVTFEEQLKLVAKEDGLHYAALVPENNGWVFFKITEKSDRHFVCENPAHDFPKKIAYKLRDDGRLEAVISGDGQEMKFEFEKEGGSN